MQERQTDRATMLSELLPAPAEDADRARLLEQDRVAMHRDLHRSLLADAEPPETAGSPVGRP
jgi:hypothetical protein